MNEKQRLEKLREFDRRLKVMEAALKKQVDIYSIILDQDAERLKLELKTKLEKKLEAERKELDLLVQKTLKKVAAEMGVI